MTHPPITKCTSIVIAYPIPEAIHTVIKELQVVIQETSCSSNSPAASLNWFWRETPHALKQTKWI